MLFPNSNSMDKKTVQDTLPSIKVSYVFLRWQLNDAHFQKENENQAALLFNNITEQPELMTAGYKQSKYAIVALASNYYPSRTNKKLIIFINRKKQAFDFADAVE